MIEIASHSLGRDPALGGFSGIIFMMLLINAAVGFFQERKAENAIELLKQRLALDARVLPGTGHSGDPGTGAGPG